MSSGTAWFSHLPTCSRDELWSAMLSPALSTDGLPIASCGRAFEEKVGDMTRPMRSTRMAAKDDCESARGEGDQQIVDFCTAGCLERDWQRKMEFRRGSALHDEVDVLVSSNKGVDGQRSSQRSSSGNYLSIREGWRGMAPRSVFCLCALNRCAARFTVVTCPMRCSSIGRHRRGDTHF